MKVHHNEGFEMETIGCLLKNDEDLNRKILNEVKKDDFHFQEYQRIFRVIKRMSEKGEVIDLTNVAQFYTEAFKMEYADVLERLFKIESSTVTTAHAEYHIKKLREMSIKRQFKKVCKEIELMTDTEDFESINEYKSKIFEKLDINIDGLQRNDNTLTNHLQNYFNDLDERYSSGKKSIIETGYKFIDKRSNGMLNGLTYVGARPSIGKTTFVINVLNNLVSAGKKSVFFNLEMSSSQIIEKIVNIRTKLGNEKLREPWGMDDKDYKMIAKGSKDLWKNGNNVHIVDDIFILEEIESYCFELKARDELDCVFIDYLQLIGSNQKFSSRYALFSEVSRRLKLLQKKLNIPIWCLAQLSRDSAGTVPEVHHLKESGSLEQDADRIFLLHDESAGEYEKEKNSATKLMLIVGKNRFGERDIIGNIKYYKNTQAMYQD